MRHSLHAALLGSILTCASALAAEPPASAAKRTATPEDKAAIAKVAEDFQTAIKTKNPKLLSTLVLDANILFTSPAPPEDIARARERFDTTFNGVRAGGYNDFARFIGSTKDAIEERFHDLQITQDGNVAWVMFDYEFVMNGKVQNFGVETWQLMKAVDGKWKILSVVWSTHLAPK